MDNTWGITDITNSQNLKKKSYSSPMAKDDFNPAEFQKALTEYWNSTRGSSSASIQPATLSLPRQAINICPAPSRLPDTLVPSRCNVIRGPARPIQIGLERRNKHRMNFGNEGEDGPSTQHFISEVLAEPAPYDTDFSKANWTSAIEYLTKQGTMTPTAEDPIWTSMNTIMMSRGWGKMKLVVGVVQSISGNGLGDKMVTLKDPTGTIEASIHHKVFDNTDYAQRIGVGAVLILEKVSVAKYLSRAKYLNITAKNIVAVVGTDEMIQNNRNACNNVETSWNDDENLIIPDSEDEI